MSTIENTLFVGKVHHQIPALASTNTFALDLISKSNPSEGTVISTYRQEDGRGQIGNKWESEADKNLTISLILQPHFIVPQQQFLLNQAISLAVRDFVSGYISNGVKVKWSNDVYIHNAKVAGILIQNIISAKKIQYSVVGIGININQNTFSKDIPNPTSLNLMSGQTYDLDPLLSQLCQYLEKRYLQLRTGQYELLKKEYLHHLYRFMEEAMYQYPDGEVFSGKITGLAPTGKLLVQHQKGEEAFDMKEIIFLP